MAVVNKVQALRVWTGSVLLLGIDGAGKTSLAEALAMRASSRRKPRAIRPTKGLNCEIIREGKFAINLLDPSGEPSFRGLWRSYFNVDAIVFVINSGQVERLHEARKALDEVRAKFHKAILVVGRGRDITWVSNVPLAAAALPLIMAEFDSPADVQAVWTWMCDAVTSV